MRHDVGLTSTPGLPSTGCCPTLAGCRMPSLHSRSSVGVGGWMYRDHLHCVTGAAECRIAHCCFVPRYAI